MDTATLTYNSVARGVTAAALTTRMAAAVLPRDVLIALGLRVTADATAGAPIVTRTITVSFIPSIVAGATPVVTNEGRIASMLVAPAGLDYILPPHVTIVDPNRRLFPPSIQSHTDGLPPGGPDTIPGNLATFRSFLNVGATTLVAGGAGYSATPLVGFIGGLPPANRLGLVPEASIGKTDLTLPPTGAVTTGCVRSVAIKDSGLGYPAGTTVTFEGGGVGVNFRPAQGVVTLSPSGSGRILAVTITEMGSGYTSVPEVVFRPPGTNPTPPRRIAKAFAAMAQGRPATATATVLAGVITALVITDNGDGYVEPPLIVITDPTGTNASAFARMGVGRIDVICPGTGYSVTGLTSANVPITPQFKRNFPDASDQRAPLWKLFEKLIQATAITPVNSGAPVL